MGGKPGGMSMGMGQGQSDEERIEVMLAVQKKYADAEGMVLFDTSPHNCGMKVTEGTKAILDTI